MNKKHKHPYSGQAKETIYNGFKFRSRLEARWATFFDALDIEYRYEVDKFELPDVGVYLPDFYLPTYDCWIEIKGQEPTEQEMLKADRLAFCTGKDTFIFFGDCWIPENNPGQKLKSSIRFHPAHVWKYRIEDAHKIDNAEDSAHCEVIQIDSLLAKLLGVINGMDAMLCVGTHKDTHERSILVSSATVKPTSQDNYECYPGNVIIDKRLEIPANGIFKLLEPYIEIIKAKLYMEEGYDWGVCEGEIFHSQWWCECPVCHSYGIAPLGYACHLRCGCLRGGREISYHNSYRLRTAYTEARQARFEHGEKRK